MNVLGISGTPRESGNSEILLDYSLKPFLQKGWEVDRIHLSEIKISPCEGCDNCLNSGECCINDGMKDVINKFKICDALIVSTPVYYRTPTAQLLSLFQRHYSVRNEKPLLGKPGGAIAVGRGTGGGQAISINIIYIWMLSCGMVCVPGELNGVTACADTQGDILHQEKRLKQAELLGENVLKISEKLGKEMK